MRYDNWDVIVFARDSHIPIQEFRTACYASQDAYGRQLPILTCYIASLPTSFPFRISIHLWTGKAKPSAIIESRKKPNQRVVYTAQVIVDGVRVFHEFYEFNAWPQEIVHKKQLLGYPEHASSQQRQPLDFPPFHQNILIQNSWDARENNGRIKLLLSEQLVSNVSNPGDLGFGVTKDIVCFSFQHAPRDILEQAGISWPIRNPLYLPPASEGQGHSSALQSPWLYTPSRDPFTANHIQSPLNKTPGGSTFVRPPNPEPLARPKTDPPPQISRYPRRHPPGTRVKTRLGKWSGDTGNSSAGIPSDDRSMDTWTTRQSKFTSTSDASMPDLLFASPQSLRNRSNHHTLHNDSMCRQSKHWEDNQPPTRGEEKQVVVTLREDQFGQLVEALSPPKRGRDCESSRHSDQDRRCLDLNAAQMSTQAFPPKMATGVPINTRPSAAALARTVSYPDFNPYIRTLSSKLSPTNPDDKAEGTHQEMKSPEFRMYNGSFASRKETRVPKSLPVANGTGIRTLCPGTLNQSGPNGVPGLGMRQSQGQGMTPSNWDSDVSMRNPSSVFSSLTSVDKRERQRKDSPAPTPASSGTIKSRKEGLMVSSVQIQGAVDQGGRHDHSLLPSPNRSQEEILGNLSDHAGNIPNAAPTHQQTSLESMLNTEERANDPFIPRHKSGAESLDSIGRVEKQLFSALGEELSFNHQEDNPQLHHDHTIQDTTDDSTQMANGLLTGLSDFENSPVQKRKRNGTFGADRGRSPIMKVAREVVLSGEMDVDVVKAGKE